MWKLESIKALRKHRDCWNVMFDEIEAESAKDKLVNRFKIYN